MQPNLVVHADWGSNARKRWLARAVLQSNGQYHVHAPEPVGEPETLLTRLHADASGRGLTLAGFDFPIGLPLRYAWRAGVASFLNFLRGLGEGDWADFYRVAEHPDEISVWRPFYPQRPGGTRQEYLLEGLGMDKIHLLRRCDREHIKRKAAAPLFWTMGAQQVGKAAIIGWRDVLAPALHNKAVDLAIWPFSGPLHSLLQPGRMVVAETYPAECYRHLGVSLAVKDANGYSGKRSQFARQHNAPRLLAWASETGVSLDADLQRQINDGFGVSRDGEDPFDAIVGLFGMLNVALKRRPPGEPYDEDVRRIEGWILGQIPDD